MRDKVTRQCPQTTTFLRGKESQSNVEPRSFRLPAYRLTARPNRLTIRGCVARWSLVLHCNPVTAAGMGLTPLLPKPPSHTKPPPPPFGPLLPFTETRWETSSVLQGQKCLCRLIHARFTFTTTAQCLSDDKIIVHVKDPAPSCQ